MIPDEAQEYDTRLRWWRIHCVAVVALLPLGVAGAIVKHGAVALPIGLALALAASARRAGGTHIVPA